MITFDKYNDDFDSTGEDDGCGSMTLTCDDCDFEEVFDDNDWQGCFADAKSLGWRTYKEGEDWKHRCPECATNFIS